MFEIDISTYNTNSSNTTTSPGSTPTTVVQ